LLDASIAARASAEIEIVTAPRGGGHESLSSLQQIVNMD
jgi:hypothetical protein